MHGWRLRVIGLMGVH